MAFNTPLFLIFFAVVFTCNWLIPKRFRWIWLLVASYVFYGLANPLFIAFLSGTTVLAYVCAILTERFSRAKNLWTAIAVVGACSVLGFFKYFNFIAGVFTGGSFSALDLILPLGLSFYTFQIIAYVTDVHRGVVSAQKNLFKFALFVSFFPHILQGPIPRYNDLAEDGGLIAGADFDVIKIADGAKRFLIGLIKKMVVADLLGVFVDAVYGDYNAYGGVVLALATVGFALQMYYDFSGFIDMAIGAAGMLGIKLGENFDKPYFSKSISEFWRRWHISLGAWFRDYLYYPILRSKGMKKLSKFIGKKSKKAAALVPVIFALTVVWLTTGLWHGAAWTFIIWGAYHGALIISETVYSKLVKKRLPQKLTSTRGWQALLVFKTFLLVCVGYVFFRAANVGSAFSVLGAVIARPDYGALSVQIFAKAGLSIMNLSQIALGIVLVALLSKKKTDGDENFISHKAGNKIAVFLNCAVIIACAVLGYIVANTLGGTANQFIYFDF